MCIVLALEARRGPNTQDQVGRLMEATGHLFEEVTTSHLKLLERSLANHSTPVFLPTALEEIRCGTSQGVVTALSSQEFPAHRWSLRLPPRAHGAQVIVCCAACFRVSLLFAMMLRSASSINWNAFLERDIVAHFVVFLNYQKDEAMFRDTFENQWPLSSAAALVRRRNTCLWWPWWPSGARTLKTKVSVSRRQRATYHPPGVAGKFACKSSHTSWPSDSSGRNKVWDFTSRVFLTVGVADTPWHPQFSSAFTFEFRV